MKKFLFLAFLFIALYSLINITTIGIDILEVEKLKDKDENYIRQTYLNTDVVGWIKVDETNISYPIMVGSSDEYYLYRSVDGKYNSSGSIFSYSNTDLKNDKVVFIFGHNMKYGGMFADLLKYTKGFKGDVDITVDGTNVRYKVFSSFICSDNDDIFSTKNENLSGVFSIESLLKRDEFINGNFSKIDTLGIVLLVTCYGNDRLVVCCFK